MFRDEYKEACEQMKLNESFKSGLTNMMKSATANATSKRRLVLATVIGVILISTTVVLATNYATNGKLLKNMFGGSGDYQNQTEVTEPLATEATEATEVPVVTEATEATEATETTAAPTAVPTVDPNARVAPVVTATAGSTSVTVSWSEITSPDLVGYKVVASKSDSTPMYSENGYYQWITDAEVKSCTIKNGASYNGGDFSKFSGGTTYYFSVTAVYGEEWQTVAGNAVQVKMPGEPAPTPTPKPTADPSGRVAPSVSVVAGDNSVKISWSKITSPDLEGYKVVASKSDSTPMYNENGYCVWITNLNTTSYTISNGEGYNGGDVGHFSGGTSYYFSVTAVYKDNKNEIADERIAGNAVYLTMPGAPYVELTGTHPPVTFGLPAVEGGAIKYRWMGTTDEAGFQYYKVMISTTDSTPIYQEAGCDYVLVGGLADNAFDYYYPAELAGQTVYVSITTVYSLGGETYKEPSAFYTLVLPAV
jgi:hypothetical protein